MKVLFVCNQGKHRSKTACEIFNGWNTKFAGLYSNILTRNQLIWADLVIVMEDFQRSEIGKRFPREYLSKKILCLNIPDIYSFQQPELKELLKERMTKLEIV